MSLVEQIFTTIMHYPLKIGEDVELWQTCDSYDLGIVWGRPTPCRLNFKPVQEGQDGMVIIM